MKELYVTAYELSQITGRPLPDILKDLRNSTIKYQWIDGNRKIPLSQFYPTLMK